MRELLTTEYYTLIDALIWFGCGFALAMELFKKDEKKQGEGKKHGEH